MSYTKSFISEIKNIANEISQSTPENSWYECLDKATLSLTNNQKHFVELSPQFQNILLGDNAGLKECITRKAKKIAKDSCISHGNARAQASSMLGIKNHKQVNQLSYTLLNGKENAFNKLKSLSGRNLVKTAREFIQLPLLFENIDFIDVMVEQFDYISVPLISCKKHNLNPTVIENNQAILPIAVIKRNNLLIDCQLPEEFTEIVMKILTDENCIDIKYQLKLEHESINFYEVN